MKGILALWCAGELVRLAMRLNRAGHVGFSWDGSELHVTVLHRFGDAEYARALQLQGMWTVTGKKKREDTQAVPRSIA